MTLTFTTDLAINPDYSYIPHVYISKDVGKAALLRNCAECVRGRMRRILPNSLVSPRKAGDKRVAD